MHRKLISSLFQTFLFPVLFPLIRLLTCYILTQFEILTCTRLPISAITTNMATLQSEGHPKPDEKTLREAGELEVLDESGKAITFNQLYNTENRQVIVFIRHFFCGVSG